MKPKFLIRFAAGCLLFFLLGHTAGHFTRHDVEDPKAQAVLKQMIDNKFDMFGSLRSYDENYTGMSLNLLFTLAAFAAILWIISNRVEADAKSAASLLLPIAVCVLGFAITSLLYFFVIPAITCLIASTTLHYAYYRIMK